jgi:hypothetical protein
MGGNPPIVAHAIVKGDMKTPSGVSVGVIAVTAICLIAVITWFSYRKLISCETHEVVIDQSNPAYSVLRTDTACDGIASSYDVSLELVGPSGQRLRILDYGDGTSFVRSGDESKPILRWLDDHTLEVEIGTVAYVNLAIGHAGNVTINYKIGKIMFKA